MDVVKYNQKTIGENLATRNWQGVGALLLFAFTFNVCRQGWMYDFFEGVGRKLFFSRSTKQIDFRALLKP